MTVETYLKHFLELIKKHPELKKAKVIYSIDDEGNDYKDVQYGASPFFKGEEGRKENLVCVN